jgi:hypothetical protein
MCWNAVFLLAAVDSEAVPHREHKPQLHYKDQPVHAVQRNNLFPKRLNIRDKQLQNAE